MSKWSPPDAGIETFNKPALQVARVTVTLTTPPVAITVARTLWFEPTEFTPALERFRDNSATPLGELKVQAGDVHTSVVPPDDSHEPVSGSSEAPLQCSSMQVNTQRYAAAC